MKIMDVHPKEQVCQYEEILDKTLGGFATSLKLTYWFHAISVFVWIYRGIE